MTINRPQPLAQEFQAFQAVATLSALIVIGVGMCVLTGWLLHIPFLEHLLALNNHAMKPNAATGFILAGTSLWMLQFPSRRYWRHCIINWSAFAVVLIGLLTLSEYTLNLDFGMDQLLIPDHAIPSRDSHPGRIDSATAVNFVLVGYALLFLDRDMPRFDWFAQLLSGSGGLIALLALVSHLFGVSSLGALTFIHGMPAPSSLAFMVLGVGVLLTHPYQGVMKTMTGSLIGSWMARWLMPWVLTLPLLLGWLIYLGWRLGWYDTSFSYALLVMVMGLGLVVLVGRCAALLNQVDAHRRDAELKLWMSEGRLRTVIEQAPFIIQLFALDGSLLQTNPVWEEVWQAPRSSLEGYNLFQDEQFRAMGLLPHFYRACAGETVNLPPLFYNPAIASREGRSRWLELFLYPLRDELGTVQQVVLAVQDITDRRKTEIALQLSEERFRRAVLDSPLPIVLHAEQGEVLQLNRAWTDITGHKLKDFVNQDAVNLPHQARLPMGVAHKPLKAILDRLYRFERCAPEEEFTIQTRTGETRTWEFYSAPLGKTPDGRRMVISTAIDITDRKRAQQERDRFFNYSHDLMRIADADGRLRQLNPAWETVLGYSPAELEGTFLFDLLHPDDVECTMHALRAEIQDGQGILGFENRYRHKDGSYRWLAWNTVPFSVEGISYGFARDITEQKQAYEFEATLKRITDEVRDSLDEEQIMQTAVRELTYTLGAGCCTIASYDLSQNISTIRYEHNTVPYSCGRRMAGSLEEFQQGYQQLLQGQPLQFCPLLGDGADASGMQSAVLCCPISDNQSVLGDVWLVNESSYRFSPQEIRLVQQVANQCAIALRQARLYQAAQTQVQELERLNQLKDDFLSTVSHELRTPMSSIQMVTEMLENLITRLGAGSSEADIERYFRVLKEECQRETKLINDLLDLSRLEAGREPLIPTTMNLQTWIPHVFEVFTERTRNQQQLLAFDLSDDLLPLTTDFSSLERILIELLNNACKYTPPDEQIVVSAYQRGDVLQLSIANSGVEISQIEQTRIFDKFYRIPNNDPWKYGGTGLGLALVKKYAEHIQGQIEVTSSQGWTTFTITLPSLNADEAD